MTPNREDIIRMAREAGIEWQSNEGITGRVRVTTCGSQSIEKIECLVQAAYAAGAAAERDRIAGEAKHIIKRAEERGAAAEREACARIAWNHEPDENGPIETAIRARGQA